MGVPGRLCPDTTRDTVGSTMMSGSALAPGSPSKQALLPTAAPAAVPQPECPWTPRQGPQRVEGRVSSACSPEEEVRAGEGCDHSSGSQPSALTVLLGTGTLASSTCLARHSCLPSSAQALASQHQPLPPPVGHLLCAGTLPTMPPASCLISQQLL